MESFCVSLNFALEMSDSLPSPSPSLDQIIPKYFLQVVSQLYLNNSGTLPSLAQSPLNQASIALWIFSA